MSFFADQGCSSYENLFLLCRFFLEEIVDIFIQFSLLYYGKLQGFSNRLKHDKRKKTVLQCDAVRRKEARQFLS